MWWFNSLPDGIKKLKKDEYELDCNTAYPLWLNMLGLECNQYSIEIVRRCITEHLHEKLNKPFSLTIKYDPRWKTCDMEECEGADKGAEDFRKHYEWLIDNKLI